MIVTFLALLELLKMNRLCAIQDGNFGEIVLAPPGESDAASEWDETSSVGEPHGND
jgi:chromatin segregation and condensation protein Rec8/ScpA/Scc1 (kleisin family)